MCHTLIIEDEAFIAELIGIWAQNAGARSSAFAATQADALRLALENPPAFIISDVRLKSGTGPAAVAQIKAALGNIPTIFITGSPEECEPCDDAIAILTKPADANTVITLFRQHAPV